LARDALGARRVLVGVAELALEHAVGTAHLLLFAQLLAVVGKPRAALLPVLAGRVGAPLNRALVGKALLALEKELLAFAAAVSALVEVLRHVYTLRRLGGRQPLCGIGSIADVTPIPHNGCRPPKR